MYYSYDELYHHGRLGQRWGVKNGPPYPLSNNIVSRVYRKIRQRSADKKREAAERQEQEEKERIEKEKERLIKEGSAKEIYEKKDMFTPAEIEQAMARIRLDMRLEELARKDADKYFNAINDVFKRVGYVKDWMKVGNDIYQEIDRAMKNYGKAGIGKKK